MNDLTIIFLIIFVVIFYAIYCYNHSLSLNQFCISAKSNLGSFIKKMESIFEKVLNESAKGTEFEKEVLKSITKIRKLGSDNPNLVRSGIDNELVRFEAYPNIRSQSLREKYQNEVSKLEREIQNSTEIYNDYVVDYNTFIKSFPANIFCSLYGRKAMKFID